MNISNTSAQASVGVVNVLVHGLFFMRLSAGQTFLELVAPKLTEGPSNPHLFLGGVRGDLRSLNGTVDWREIGLIGDPASPVAAGQMPSNLHRTVLQFSLSTTMLGGWNSAYEGGKIWLKWPKRISSLRCDYFDRAFLYDLSGRKNIGDEIKGRCRGGDVNAKTGIVTCLEYQYDTSVGVNIPNWSPGLNLHCCFEPAMKHSISDVNEDLGQAASLFQTPANFDLRMRDEAGAVITNPGENCSGSASGIKQGDDLSLGEGLNRDSSQQVIFNVNPANCPNFFVGP